MRHLRFGSLLAVWILLAGAAFASPPPPAANARPTHLRPVQSKADCKTITLAAFVCDAAVRAGDLQLIWDEPNKAATGYKVFRVDAGAHQLLGTATPRYFLVKKPPEGYANLCFAVQAVVANRPSADSARYCYAPGATATTRALKASHIVTQVSWSTPTGINCGGPSLSGSAFFQGADKVYGSDFTAFFPFLRSASPNSGRATVSNGVYAGSEAALLKVNVKQPDGSNLFGGSSFCSVPPNGTATVEANAVAGVAFDLGDLASHKFYSAALTLESVQTLVVASGKAVLQGGGWCAVKLGAASREWRISPLGNLTYAKRGAIALSAHPPAQTDVTPIVSRWASQKYAASYGFIVAGVLVPGPHPPTGEACVTKYASPSLKVVYF